MRRLNQIGALLIFAISFFGGQAQATADSIVQITAEVQGLEQVAPADLPSFGTYWLAMPNAIFAPIPSPPTDTTLPVYSVADGIYLVDETDGWLPRGNVVAAMATESNAVVNLINNIQATEIVHAMGSMEMGLPVPPGGSGGGDITNSYSLYSYNTNLLYLQISNVFNGTAYTSLYNATNQVYSIWSTPDLTIPFADWQVETELFPTVSTTNILPFTVPILGRPNLFLWAQDWTGVYANGLPCWWTWYYFHTLDGLTAASLDSQGNTLGHDYTNSIDPDTIAFAIDMTNSDVNTACPNLPVDIIGGVPGYAAVLVNDTNLSHAAWQPFTDSSVMAILGADGDYNVSVGLRGFPTNATPSWQTITLTKNTIFPQLTITNPVVGTISQSLIQFQGFASEPLDTLTFDLANANGTLTNQQGYLIGLFYDNVRMAYTTNYFQSDNIYLASGSNTITLHATDWAGNKTNASFTINFSANTNPPVLTLVWPQAGTAILGTNFTLQAQVSDPTATVSATINGSSTPGLVDAHGLVWVQNLTLNPGTNTVTLTAATALGGLDTTNFAVVTANNDMELAVNPLDNSELNQGLISVSGSVNDLSTYAIYVNGVPAYKKYLNSNTAWEADGVPVSAFGMAAFDVQVSNSAVSATENMDYAQPVTVTMSSYAGHQNLTYSAPPDYEDYINWFYQSGGNLSDNERDFWGISAATNGMGYTSSGSPFVMPWEYASLSVTVPFIDAYLSINYFAVFESHTQTRVMIAPGGVSPAGTTNTYLVLATACEFSATNIDNARLDYAEPYYFLIGDPYGNNINADLPYGGDLGLPPGWLQINGKTLIATGMTNTISAPDGQSINSVWGATIVSAPAGQNPDVTPVATRVYQNLDYTFNVLASNLVLQIIDTNTTQNLSAQTNTVIVGQQMDLACQLSITSPFMTNFILTNIQWMVSGYAVTNFYVSTDNFQTNGYPVLLSQTNNQYVHFWWADGTTNRVVQCSATVNGATVTGQATFNVLRPTIKINAMTSSIRIGIDTSGDVFRMYFGQYLGTNTDAIPGIQFSNTITMPPGTEYNYGVTNYSIYWVQLITANPLSLIAHGTNHTFQTTGIVLDTQYPASDVADSMDDSPGISLEEPGETAASDSVNFKTWVMFKPYYGGWVPLRTVTWNINCTASLSGTNWMLSNASWLTNPPDADSGTTYPVWTNNVANTNSFSWNPPF